MDGLSAQRGSQPSQDAFGRASAQEGGRQRERKTVLAGWILISYLYCSLLFASIKLGPITRGDQADIPSHARARSRGNVTRTAGFCCYYEQQIRVRFT